MDNLSSISILYLFLDVIISYLIGSISTGYIAVKLLANKDIREVGSGSTGATNVKRVLGKKWFFIVLLIDALKGALPVIASKLLFAQTDTIGIFPVVAAMFVILGHSKPIFLQFKGGKSVASGVGTMLALNPLAGIIVAVIWAAITYFTKYVSVGSIIAISASPVIMYLMHNPICYVIYCILAALYIIYLHRENIKRLMAGNENKVR